MGPQLFNGYEYSQKQTDTTGNITSQFNHSHIHSKQTNHPQPIQLYKEDSESSDAQIIYKQPVRNQQKQWDLPKKLPIHRYQYLDKPQHLTLNNDRVALKNKKVKASQEEREKTEAQHYEIRKFIKKADRLNEQNYRRLQYERSMLPAFNTNSNINIYKSSKNILEQIGGEEPSEKRIKQIYLREQRKNKNSKLKSTLNRSLNNPKSINNRVKNNLKNQSVDKKTIQIQTQIIEPVQSNKIKINKAFELLEDDPDFEPAVPKKNLNHLTQKRNNRLLSNTLSVLNDSENLTKKQISLNQKNRYNNYSKVQAEEYLNNLSKTQHDFLKSVRNQKRSVSALTMDEPAYQATVFGVANGVINGSINLEKIKLLEEAGVQKKEGGENSQTLEFMGKMEGRSHWEDMEIQQPQGFKKLENMNKTGKLDKIEKINKVDKVDKTDKVDKLNRIQRIQKLDKTQKQSQKQPIKNLPKQQTKQQTKQIDLPIEQQNSQKIKHQKVGTQNSLAVQNNQSVKTPSNLPDELQHNVTKMFRQNPMQSKISSNMRDFEFGTKTSFWDRKRESGEEMPSPILHEKSIIYQEQQFDRRNSNIHPIQKSQKSVQAPQLPKLDPFNTANPKHKPIHPITISFTDRDKDWITKQYYNQKMKSRVINASENKTIMTDNFRIKKYRNGVYFGEIDQHKESKHGYGAIFYFNGKMYEGFFKNDVKEGKGIQNFPDGSSYVGDYAAGLKNGKGVYSWNNGQEIYEGQWVNGKRNGSGMWKRLGRDNKYDIYIGEWTNGKIQGFGVLTVSDGHRYEGQFKNSEKQGLGTQRYDNGDTFVGEFHKGRPNGMGEYYWASGGYYKGQFSNGLKHGKGYYKGQRTVQHKIQQKPQQQQKQSLLKKKPLKPKKKPQNKKAPKKYNPPNYPEHQQEKKEEVQYWGEFRNDKKCGFGQEKIVQAEEGCSYSYRGNFQNDLRHGYGEIVQEGKFTVKGYWINGVKVGEEMGVIQEDQLERVQSIPQKLFNTKAKIKKEGPESLSKGKKNLKNSLSPKQISPKISPEKHHEHGEGIDKRPCGCKRSH